MGGKFFPPYKFSECCIDWQDGGSFSFHESTATITSPSQKKKTTLFVETLLVHVLHFSQNWFYFVLLTPLPSLLTMEQTHEINMALDMAQLFAIWKLPIPQLYNCKKIKNLKKINQKIQSFSVYSKDRENRVVGERRGKPTTKKKTKKNPACSAYYKEHSKHFKSACQLII